MSRELLQHAHDVLASIKSPMYVDEILRVGKVQGAIRDYLAQPAPAAPDLIPPDALFVCGQMGANVTRVRAESAAPAVPDDVLRALLKHNEELFAAYRARTAVPAVPAVREPLTDEQVSYLEQQAFASTNHTIERPIYQHWFRKGVRAGYGITGDSNG